MNGGTLNRAGLTVKQNAFVHYYIKTRGNGVKAAQLAGYETNYNSLGAIASENLNKPKIKSELKRRLSKVLTSEEVLQKLSTIVDSDVEFKGSDVVKCAELLAKHHGLIKERVETSSDNTETKLHISSEIQSLAEDLGKSEAEIELEMQLRFANKLRKSYDPSLDPTVHPEVWKSGNLLRDREIEAESESVS